MMSSARNAAWYALKVRGQYEKVVARNLAAKDYEVFLPLVRSRRRWSDRIKEVEVPLFPGYVLTRFEIQDRLPLLMVPGVSHVVSVGREPSPVSEGEVEAIRSVVNSRSHYEPWPFIRVGQRVRVEYGALAGLEGWVVEIRKSRKLVVPLTLLQRSVAVEIDRDWVEPIPTPHTCPAPVSVS